MLLSIKLTSLLFTIILSLMLKSTEAFCIYNRLFVGSPRITVFQSYTSGKKFSKRLNLNEVQCCHYSNRDCNKSGSQDSYISFFVSSRDDGGSAKVVHCAGGGALSFWGTSMDNISAVCVYPSGHVDTSIISL